MVVLLVLLTFAVFVTIDIVKERRRRAALRGEGEMLHNALRVDQPTFVGGFRLPPQLSYHPGHTWVHATGGETAYVGIDDFARRILGRDAKLAVPDLGTVLNQGKGVIEVRKNGTRVSLLSPVAGEIIAVNPEIARDPELPYRDSYGRGWLFKVHTGSLKRDLSNLLRGSLAKKWMEDTRERFQHQLTLATGSVIQDGGVPVEDIAGALSPRAWQHLVEEFLTPEVEGS